MARKRQFFRSVTVIAALSLALAGCFPSADPGSVSEEAILADIGTTRDHLLITNNNSFVWSQVTFVLNGTYRYKTDTVPRGGTSISLSSFADDSGQAYARTALGVHHVTIHVAKGLEGREGWFEW